MRDELAARLARMSEPRPPLTLQTSVMARVWRVAEEREAKVLAHQPGPRGEKPSRGWSDSAAMAATLGGLVFVAAAWLGGPLERGWWRDLVASQAGSAAMPPFAWPAVLCLAIGLLLFVGGLFAPVGDRRS